MPNQPEHRPTEAEVLDGLRDFERRTGRLLTFAEVYRHLNSRYIRPIDPPPPSE